MENKLKCNYLEANYKVEKMFMRGPINFELDVSTNQTYHIIIKQNSQKRDIMILSETEVEASNIYDVLTRLERLLMVMDGYFIRLENLSILNSKGILSDELNKYAKDKFEKRLNYYYSDDFCKNVRYKLVDFESILTSELFKKWNTLLDDLGNVNQMFLYAISSIGLPIDIKCAFLIEMAESFADAVKIYTSLIVRKNRNGKKTLRNYLDALINKYGKEIFQKELSYKYGKFLRKLVNSRVNIMHIKLEEKKPYLNGNDSYLYSLKFYFLYRKIMLDLLDVNESEYKDNLQRCISLINSSN